MLAGDLAKPWIGKKDKAATISYFLTYSMLLLGIGLSFLHCYLAWRRVPLLGKLCLVMEDDFNGDELDSSIWMREADMGGFGNGEFEMTTTSSNNSFVRNGELYILPTVTSDVIGREAIFNGHTFNLTGCTNTNLTACGAVSNATTGAVINPVMSARISTKGKRSIQYGRVELWPAIWMLPENNTYGPWPLSGEIDIMEARGNGPAYSQQGINYVRGSLNWGPLTWLNAVSKTFGWWTMRRSTYADSFHTYALEWTQDFLRVYVDNRLQHMLNLRFNVPFFQRGDFPSSVSNASQEIIVPNPWSGRGNRHPLISVCAASVRPHKQFYLILDVAVGGTNGWFPDGAGNKPWLNGALDAMELFAKAQDTWYKTWPESQDDRAMRIDYVKMWEQC
ncbi:glycoside hydrolase family 16 protein [Lactifluus volemus]|nr:glycoside hydrolase family 16 protein [Lactifluus volemus]